MKQSRLSIGTKIFGGFITLIFIFTLNAGISVLTTNSNNRTIEETAKIINPSAKAIDDLIDLVVTSKMLITNWVYLQNNQEDKEALKELQNFQYPALKTNLTVLMTHWKDESEKKQLDTIFTDFEALMAIEKEIMATLISFEDYEDPMIKLLAENSIEDEVLPRTSTLEQQLREISRIKRTKAEKAQISIIASSSGLQRLNIILGLVTIAIGLLVAFFLNRNITRPISYVKDIVIGLGKGQLPEKDREKTQQFSRDEVGDMAQAVDELVSGLRDTSEFAENIGQGTYDAEFAPLSEEDVLGNALINMRNNLRSVSEEDKKRHWTTEGTAIFGELLRQNSGSVQELSSTILSKLIEYMHANQGGLFVVQEDSSSEEPYMVLEACYALGDREKYIEQKIYQGEGLAGQAWLEKDTLYITDVPSEYITIVSGLGEANPTSILIVPLMVNEEVYGIVEIASFDEYQPHEVEFIKKIAESIASTISTARTNSKTQNLLNESKQMTEQMQAQEEEMRQNMEELQATQEEMDRKQRSMESREARIKAVLNNASASYVSINEEGYVDFFNSNATETFGYGDEELEGIHASKLLQGINAIDVSGFLEQHVNQEIEQSFLSKQGKTFHATLRISAYQLRDTQGFVARISSAVHDTENALQE